MSTLRCPFCNAAGINNIDAHPFGPALVIFCKNCGAIHGAIPTPTKQPDPPRQLPKPEPQPEPDKQTQQNPPQGGMTPERMAAMAPYFNRGSTNYRIIRPLTDDEAKGE